MSSVADKLAKKTNRKPPGKQVRLRLVYIDFWSAVKLSFLVAVCLAVVNIVASFLVFTVLSSTGIFEQVNSLVQDVAGAGTDLRTFFSLGNVMGFAVIVSLLNLVVTTALGAVVAVLYNLSVKITGGILVGFTNS
ncbi:MULTISPECIES: DUF3566 domain-containing protein [Agromyces]|jgi:hypothetical protein|uniref:DUF3566 domain-containing protein n=1 Tax=Agromyces indicus TaxID=758919 RepID=A0ABU1FH44_9MICO|nr:MULTISPECIES: DUF3566 domain-containing protein [Agromyces]KZE93813.1 hypothetical protein AVP42_01430 [Agromyces sp. NDB4Y10]MCK8610743.1 DUF3566 domain-containing protein [Agromyces sp. C10]MDR5690746.1 DUF3566 domain-containing protein [Agromyces indicus]